MNFSTLKSNNCFYLTLFYFIFYYFSLSCMVDNNFIEKYDNYDTKYYESISEFVNNLNLLSNFSKHLNVMCTNIGNQNANFDELILFLENDTHSKNIDILILTKSWHINADNFGSLTGCNTYSSTIKRNQNDGVIIFVKSSLTVS